ncbi:MAG: hypothetical protein COZ93_05125, partial [Nitrospirae bacterium CG_4_8_14_3_um_filter_44_28]
PAGSYSRGALKQDGQFLLLFSSPKEGCPLDLPEHFVILQNMRQTISPYLSRNRFSGCIR